MRLTFAATLLAIAFVLALAKPAGAQLGPNEEEDDDSGTEVLVGGAQIGVIVWTDGTVYSAPGQWPKCNWTRVRLADVAPLGLTYDLTLDQLNGYLYRELDDGTREYLYLEHCKFADGSTTNGYAFIGDATPVDVTELARAELFELAPDPTGAVSPGADVNHLVGLPTWIWLDEVPEPVEATAEVPGLSATAVATPDTLIIITGDGAPPTECALDTPAYSPGADPDTGCTHVFERISEHSPTGTWDLQIELEWEFTWTNSLGDAGTAEPIVTTIVLPLDVIELQARIVDPSAVGG